MRRGIGGILALLLSVSLCPSRLAAQGARGVVLDRAQSPVAGVVVVLLDVNARESARALSNERGEFRLAAPAPGSYRIRTMRIGFRPTTSDVIQLAVGQEVVQQVVLTDVGISLDTVKVVGKNSCSIRPDTAAATFALWEQVRAALTATQLSSGNRQLNARLVTYQRTLDPGRRRRVLRQTAQVHTGATSRPWNSLPADSLRKAGYVVTGVDGLTTFFAPDIAVLLSDSFVEDHCFRIASSDAQRIGIDFEPTRDRRKLTDIKGTLWLDRASSELRRMEFTYENLPELQQTGEPGGDLDFVRMRNGAWMISRWNIRMPVLDLREEVVSGIGASRSRRTESYVREIRVEGGSLALVMRMGDTLWARPPQMITGIIRDSTSGGAIADAVVRLRGTVSEALTDKAGRYDLRDVLPGEYMLEVTTPALRRVGAAHSVPVTFADSAQSYDLRVPSPDQLLGALCRGSGGIVAGYVIAPRDSMPPRGVRVFAEWVEFQARATEILRVTRTMETATDPRGGFRFCDAPVNTNLTLRLESDKGAAEPVDVRIAPRERMASADLLLDLQAPAPAVLTGIVMSDINSQPIPDAEVALPRLGKNAFSDSAGRYRITGIAPGTYDVAVRRVGYRPTMASVALAPNQRLERSLLLSKAQLLDTVRVVAPAFATFEENRKLGMGHFITRAELAKQEERRLSDILATVPGINIVMSQGYATVASSRRGHVSMTRFESALGSPKRVPVQDYCYAQVYLNGGLVYRAEPDEKAFDLNSLPVNTIEAIEYYAASSMVPTRYTLGKPRCGVLVIHTRSAK